MIARTWHGVTPASKADEYLEFLKKTGVKDYRATMGNRGVFVLRKVSEDRADFLLLSLWDEVEGIRRFAGPDAEKAFYYPEDEDFLLEFEPVVTHHEVLVGP
ncbi:MAG: antibiotic biosynthesis monooxygenase [Candidatus Thermoplasmatota archaeon]